MATAELPHPHTRRPFRALEDTLDDEISRWDPRADAEGDGDGDGDPLIGGDTSGTSPRATVTLIGAGGSLIRGGTLIGASGMRAPLEPAPPAGSGGAPDRHGTDADGAWDGADELTLEDDLLLSLAADRERLTDIARALGACPACWGERIGCPRCGGVGRPGSENPATEAFDWYVRPLLHRLDADGTLRSRPRPVGSEAHPAGRGPAYWVDPD
jgi:hypothetical protein